MRHIWGKTGFYPFPSNLPWQKQDLIKNHLEKEESWALPCQVGSAGLLVPPPRCWYSHFLGMRSHLEERQAAALAQCVCSSTRSRDLSFPSSMIPLFPAPSQEMSSDCRGLVWTSAAPTRALGSPGMKGTFLSLIMGNSLCWITVRAGNLQCWDNWEFSRRTDC